LLLKVKDKPITFELPLKGVWVFL